MPRSPSDSLSRRRFLTRSAAVAGGGLALPAFLRSAVSASPAETIVTGHVGVGGRGGSLLGQVLGSPAARVAAVCDVDAGRRDGALGRVEGPDAKAYGDYRKVLERDDIDAVVIATPDHWHAGVTIAACRAGKDVYVEKPLCHNVAEGRAMVNAARDHERVVQMGINHRSASYSREIASIVRGGRIGRVREVKCWMWSNRYVPRTGPSTPPSSLDFDFWLGPAPAVAYHPDRSHYNFRWCSDYAGGYMTDWGVHMLNVVTFAMDIDHMGPDSVEATGYFAPDNLYDHPMEMEAKWEFTDPDFTLTWSQPSDDGDVLPGQKEGQKHGMTFYGEDGVLKTAFGHGYWKFFQDGEEAPLPREGKAVDVPTSPGHMQNFFDSVKSREKPIADVEIGHRTTSICLIANACLFSGRRKLAWDWREEKFGGDDAANAWLSRKPREAWAV